MRKELVKNWRAKGHQYLARKALAMYVRGYIGLERALEALTQAGLSQDYSIRLMGSGRKIGRNCGRCRVWLRSSCSSCSGPCSWL